MLASPTKRKALDPGIRVCGPPSRSAPNLMAGSGRNQASWGVGNETSSYFCNIEMLRLLLYDDDTRQTNTAEAKA